ncbi:Dbl homology domain-containing protein [Macrolepiota fuliginosa MF-IS2]|uniref:Dbl homology domain-containing protein n=1 Tax=Macrolepiota fuliginosa MF-IS2 TaxID=1400762 RepID=A0A9P5X4V0_9AGAR|nr:Dbl homology domain-containing protein [Macrolepiota fuliginosa MF-IS2]
MTTLPTNQSGFTDHSMLSDLAMVLRIKVPRGTHIKKNTPYSNAFTGKNIVSTIHSQITQSHGGASNDRIPALLVARSLQSQLFFYEVEWGDRVLQDDAGSVYMFIDEPQHPPEAAEIPTGVVTVLTKCYSPSCGKFDDGPCYSYSCPRKGLKHLSPDPQQDPWPDPIPVDIIGSLTESEINRQTIIRKLLSKEGQYVHDLDLVESIFIEPLHNSGLSVSSGDLHAFIDEIFGNLIRVRDTNKRLLETLYIRQREQAPVITGIGDIFLDAAMTDFKEVYTAYIGHRPTAERLLREELEKNLEFRLFIENCSRRQITRHGRLLRPNFKHFLNWPVEHWQKYRILLKAIYKETDRSNPDRKFLAEAIKALNKLQTLASAYFPRHCYARTVEEVGMVRSSYAI